LIGVWLCQAFDSRPFHSGCAKPCETIAGALHLVESREMF
jgi:hypothetical protein